jgi:hypothetical protein
MCVPTLLVFPRSNMKVFPRSNMKAELLDNPPPSSIASGWIQTEFYAMVQTFCLFYEAI